jgi:hypothetical protein
MSLHPNYTTRTNDGERKREADAAGRYLRQVVDVVGGEEAGGLREAFLFKEARRKSTGRGKRGTVDVGVDQDGERVLAGRYAGQQSLWSTAADFWSVVGWAFNCSVRHKGRWQRWRAWLAVMLDVLERDLEGAVTRGDLEECLLMKYLQTIGGGRNDKRRIMRAVLADGSEKAMAEFGEVWKDETRPPKVENDDSKKRKLDLENGEYGDYFDDDSANEDEQQTSSTRRSRSAANKRGPSTGTSDVSASSSTSTATGNIDTFGGHDSLHLRQRFLALLAQLSATAPKVFGADLSDLWSLYTEFLRPLPLLIFQQFISPQKAYLSPAWQASLCEMMSRALLGISGSYGIVSMASFESDIVIGTANNSTAIDNAKVGVLVESLLRLLWVQGFLGEANGTLRGLVEEGIEKREAKGSWRKKGKGGSGDEEARECLTLSGERLRVLAKLICK